MEKCEVNGECCHEIYKYLRKNSPLWNKEENAARLIPGNFAKFLISSQGKVLKYYKPEIAPNEIR